MDCKLKKSFFLFLLPLLWSCSNTLFVQTQKVNRASLASSYVDTPDPRQCCPPCGQRLVISFDFSKCKLKERLYLKGTVIFCDLSQEEISSPISRRFQTLDFYFPQNPQKKNPILSYKLEVVSGSGMVVDTWKHKLFVKPLIIPVEE